MPRSGFGELHDLRTGVWPDRFMFANNKHLSSIPNLIGNKLLVMMNRQTPWWHWNFVDASMKGSKRFRSGVTKHLVRDALPSGNCLRGMLGQHAFEPALDEEMILPFTQKVNFIINKRPDDGATPSDRHTIEINSPLTGESAGMCNVLGQCARHCR